MEELKVPFKVQKEKEMQKVELRHREESNPGPPICKASMLTITLSVVFSYATLKIHYHESRSLLLACITSNNDRISAHL